MARPRKTDAEQTIDATAQIAPEAKADPVIPEEVQNEQPVDPPGAEPGNPEIETGEPTSNPPVDAEQTIDATYESAYACLLKAEDILSGLIRRRNADGMSVTRIRSIQKMVHESAKTLKMYV